MHEHLWAFEQNPSQKFSKNLNNFENSQNLSKKNPKVRSKEMKCMINERKGIIPKEESDLETED